MPYKDQTEKRERINSRRADPVFNAKYVANRRAQRARARTKKKAMKAPRTHCKHGHPRTADNLTKQGQCRLCKNARQNARRDALPKPMRIPKLKLTREQIRERERIIEEKYLGHPVLTWEQELARRTAEALTPEERKLRHKAADKRSYEKRKALRGPKKRKEFCVNGHPRTPKNLKPNGKGCRPCEVLRREKNRAAELFVDRIKTIARREPESKVSGMVD